MCIAALAWDAHRDFPLVVVANRDERHARPSAPLSQWTDGSGIVAGRDLESGGTWLGLHDSGRIALVTNVHDPDALRDAPPSRGALVRDWLADAELPRAPARFNPFNLLAIDRRAARFVTNRPVPAEADLPVGIHGVSNGPRDDPWPKVQTVCAMLERQVAAPDVASLLNALGPAGTLPSENPREAVFIANTIYGTRCSTVIVIDASGRGTIAERRYDADANRVGETTLRFAWPV